jgi:3-hydroxy-D-aspartate aldolase
MLILDLDAVERNIRKTGDYAEAHDMRHRAHGKMHKSVVVLRLQQRQSASIEHVEYQWWAVVGSNP